MFYFDFMYWIIFLNFLLFLLRLIFQNSKSQELINYLYATIYKYDQVKSKVLKKSTLSKHFQIFFSLQITNQNIVWCGPSPMESQ
jgi:hypothetical protein